MQTNSIRTQAKKIGLFGGTFDPIHFGHLNLAFELSEKMNLDEVWFIPAQINPLKVSDPPASMEHRLAMVALALQEMPRFFLKDLEKERPPPSYTIDTLKAFIEQEAHEHFPHQFFLLMGEDAVPNFSRWHMHTEIIKLAPLLIGSRSGVWKTPLDEDLCSLSVREAIQKGLIPTRLMDISGTEIRKRLAQGLYCGHLMPESVLDYIQDFRLY
jgi:nicotinate-nucleotide adenylyltransferase